jgi:hypothetical protein
VVQGSIGVFGFEDDPGSSISRRASETGDPLVPITRLLTGALSVTETVA